MPIDLDELFNMEKELKRFNITKEILKKNKNDCSPQLTDEILRASLGYTTKPTTNDELQRCSEAPSGVVVERNKLNALYAEISSNKKIVNASIYPTSFLRNAPRTTGAPNVNAPTNAIDHLSSAIKHDISSSSGVAHESFCCVRGSVYRQPALPFSFKKCAFCDGDHPSVCRQHPQRCDIRLSRRMGSPTALPQNCSEACSVLPIAASGNAHLFDDYYRSAIVENISSSGRAAHFEHLQLSDNRATANPKALLQHAEAVPSVNATRDNSKNALLGDSSRKTFNTTRFLGTTVFFKKCGVAHSPRVQNDHPPCSVHRHWKNSSTTYFLRK